jgi:ribosomal protein S19
MIRGVYFDRILIKKLFKKSLDLNNFVSSSEIGIKSKKLVSYSKRLRNSYITKSSLITKVLVNERIFVHTGKEIISIKITPSMVGFKVGEFFFIKKK